MLSLSLLSKLLSCVHHCSTAIERIVITGDKNQLPPIDIGRPTSVLYTYLSMKESALTLVHMHRAGDASVIGI